MCPSARRNELLRLRPCFIDHLLLTSDFRQVPRRNLFQFSHSLSTAAFAAGIFMACGMGINSCTKLSPLPAVWSSWWFGKDSPFRSLVDSLSSKIHASFDLISLVYHQFTILTVLSYLARQSGSHWCFQFLASILDGLFEFLVLRVNEINVHYRVEGFRVTTYASPSAWHFFPISSRVLAMNYLAWMSAAFLSVSPRTTKNPSGGFSSRLNSTCEGVVFTPRRLQQTTVSCKRSDCNKL